MMLRHLLVPTIGHIVSAKRRLMDEAAPLFQIIILHDVPTQLTDRLIAFLDIVAHESEFLTPDAAATYLREGRQTIRSTRIPPCLLSFDDGFVSSRRIALDILPRYSTKGLFFVCPGLVNSEPHVRETLTRTKVFNGHPPADVPQMMSWSDIADLHRAGHTIGSHGHMHERLSRLSGEELRAEIVDSRVEIERRIGVRPQWYAYAFGDIGSISADALQIIKHEYGYCRSGLRGQYYAGAAPMLYAQEIDLGTTSAFQRSILRGALDFKYTSQRRQLTTYWGRD